MEEERKEGRSRWIDGWMDGWMDKWMLMDDDDEMNEGRNE